MSFFKEKVLAEEIIAGITYQLIENDIHGEISWDFIELQKAIYQGEVITHKTFFEGDWSQAGVYCKWDEYTSNLREEFEQIYDVDED